eukprot:GHVN01090954.1.p1 GENE.GHVN01090954.1~~GHVN01090954.1.p1  ORF type:complete len:221 (-),score=55.72 GHVN01090954.1:709-1371(-)
MGSETPSPRHAVAPHPQSAPTHPRPQPGQDSPQPYASQFIHPGRPASHPSQARFPQRPPVTAPTLSQPRSVPHPTSLAAFHQPNMQPIQPHHLNPATPLTAPAATSKPLTHAHSYPPTTTSLTSIDIHSYLSDKLASHAITQRSDRQATDDAVRVLALSLKAWMSQMLELVVYHSHLRADWVLAQAMKEDDLLETDTRIRNFLDRTKKRDEDDVRPSGHV